MKQVQRLLFVVALLAATGAPTGSFAQSHPEFIALARVSAALYKPDQGPAPHIAFVIGHRTANYLNHIACRELSNLVFSRFASIRDFRTTKARSAGKKRHST